jgi:hypothetical protein
VSQDGTCQGIDVVEKKALLLKKTRKKQETKKTLETQGIIV